MFLHFGDDFAPFLNRAAERNHQFHVRQAHFIAHFFHRATFQGEARAISLVVVARCAAKSEHRIFFDRLVRAAADQICIFVRLEIAQPHDHIFGIKCGGDHRHALRELVHEELRFVIVTGSQLVDVPL